MFPRQDVPSIITSAPQDDGNPAIISSPHLFSLFIHEGGGSLVFRCDRENVHWLSSLTLTLACRQRRGRHLPDHAGAWHRSRWPLTWEEAFDWWFESQRSCTQRAKLKCDMSAWILPTRLPSRPRCEWSSFILEVCGEGPLFLPAGPCFVFH